MTAPQIAKLSAAIIKRSFQPGEKILTEVTRPLPHAYPYPCL